MRKFIYTLFVCVFLSNFTFGQCEFCDDKSCDVYKFIAYVVVIDTSYDYYQLTEMNKKIKEEFSLLVYKNECVYNKKLKQLARCCDMEHYVPRTSGYWNSKDEESFSIPALSIEYYKSYAKYTRDWDKMALIGMISHKPKYATNFHNKIKEKYPNSFILKTRFNQNQCFH